MCSSGARIVIRGLSFLRLLGSISATRAPERFGAPLRDVKVVCAHEGTFSGGAARRAKRTMSPWATRGH